MGAVAADRLRPRGPGRDRRRSRHRDEALSPHRRRRVCRRGDPAGPRHVGPRTRRTDRRPAPRRRRALAAAAAGARQGDRAGDRVGNLLGHGRRGPRIGESIVEIARRAACGVHHRRRLARWWPRCSPRTRASTCATCRTWCSPAWRLSTPLENDDVAALDDARDRVDARRPRGGRGRARRRAAGGCRRRRMFSSRRRPASERIAGRPHSRRSLGLAAGRGAGRLRRSDEAVEIHCHGGVAAVRAVVDRLVERGCQPTPWQDWLRETAADPIRAAAQIALAEAPTPARPPSSWINFKAHSPQRFRQSRMPRTRRLADGESPAWSDSLHNAASGCISRNRGASSSPGGPTSARAVS